MLSNLLNQSITLYPKSSLDVDGREVFGAEVNYKARVQEVSKTRFLPNGQTLIIDAIAYLSENPDVDMNDKVLYNGTRYKIHGKSVAVDGQGNVNHVKLELIKWKS